ncbi:hypothetical protein NIES4073_38480 [Kalymmatonema gypsitolerans NIES-4073]|nr:hypothetical protein NIES4073_38480 [Scytonema sp. NIES-4073]
MMELYCYQWHANRKAVLDETGKYLRKAFPTNLILYVFIHNARFTNSCLDTPRVFRRGDSWFIDSPLDSRLAPTAQVGKSRLRDVPVCPTISNEVLQGTVHC